MLITAICSEKSLWNSSENNTDKLTLDFKLHERFHVAEHFTFCAVP